MIIEKYAQVVMVENILSESIRGENCLGSTGFNTIDEKTEPIESKKDDDFLSLIDFNFD